MQICENISRQNPSEILYYDFAVGRQYNHILIYIILFIYRYFTRLFGQWVYLLY
jgi:hypothetical protein